MLKQPESFNFNIPKNIMLDFVFIIILLGIVIGFYYLIKNYSKKRNSDIASFIRCTYNQIKSQNGLVNRIFLFFILLSLLTFLGAVIFGYGQNKEFFFIGFVITFIATIATVLSLLNTYYLIHQYESRLISYDSFLERLNKDIEGIKDYNKDKNNSKYKNEYLYIMAYTPLIGSISADEEIYETYFENLKSIIDKVDSQIIMVKDYKQFHTVFTKDLPKFKNNQEKVKKFIIDRDDEIELILKTNKVSKKGKKSNIYGIPLELFPKFYVYVSRTLTAFSIIKRNPEIGNEIVAFASDDKYYKRFAYEILASGIEIYNNENKTSIDPINIFSKLV